MNQDPQVSRGKLVYQWPDKVWPNITLPSGASADDWPAHSGARLASGESTSSEERWRLHSSPPYPPLKANLQLLPCLPEGQDINQSQHFWYEAANGTIGSHKWIGGALCITYGGYREANFGLASCNGWSAAGIGSQGWDLVDNVGQDALATARAVSLHPRGSEKKCMDVFNCDVSVGSMQTCTCNGTDCFDRPTGNCGDDSQRWTFDPSALDGSRIVSVLNGSRYCVTAVPFPGSAMDIRMQVWVKPLHDGSKAVVAFNRDIVALPVSILWEWLGLTPTQAATVRDLWAHVDVGTGITRMHNVTVAPHDVVMLRVTPK